MRLVSWTLIAAASALCAGVTAWSAEHNPVSSQGSAAAVADTQRVIVKMRGIAQAPTQRVAAVVARSGLSLRTMRSLFGNMHVLQVDPTGTAGSPAAASMAATLARLRADPEVEFAEEDQRRFAHAAPNDSLFQDQWYMMKSATTPAAVDAQTAWDTTTGSSTAGATNSLSTGIVIADLDTGIRFDHPDLLWAGAGGRVLPGYDFISDVATANDGDGPDADPSDPGDWVSAADAQQAPFKGRSCIPSGQDHVDSSWHGTRTAGILGALTNNGAGIAGMTWSGWILPVRVLGKCGGFDSDILSGMMWAAGGHITGVPDNPYPARIENMSLGAVSGCPASYQSTIAQLSAMGVLVVVSAGNEGGPVDAPANCPGAAAIAGLRHAGTKVGFSSLGPEITVGAPAGNCVNTTITAQTPCVYTIDTTSNTGTTAPAANTYTDNVDHPNLGTSFSAPIVSGIAGLMLAVNGNLKSTQLIARLREGSVPYPQQSPGEVPQPPACHVPSGSSTDLQTAECICTLDGKTCGAGMANAQGALSAALRPIAAVKLTAGGTVTLDASGSAAACHHNIASYQWVSSSPGTHPVSSSTGTTTTVSAASAGSPFTVTLTVQDDAGLQDTALITVNSTTPSSPAPTTAGSSACLSAIAVASPVSVSISPTTAGLVAGSGTQTFAANVTHTANSAVIWQVNGVVGGNSTVGTITAAGVYTAPATVPAPATVAVQAVSAADRSKTGTAQVSISAAAATSAQGGSGSGSGGGGGAIDPLTLLLETSALGMALMARAREKRASTRSLSGC